MGDEITKAGEDKLSKALALAERARGGPALALIAAGHPGLAVLALPRVIASLDKTISRLVYGVGSLLEIPIELLRAKYQPGLDLAKHQQDDLQRAVHETAVENIRKGATAAAEVAKIYDFNRSASGQRNRERILEAGMNELETHAPTVDTTAEVSDDWLAHFADVASKVSEQGVANFLGRMLAGEIKQPGRYSVGAIMAIATMTSEVGELLKKFADHCTHFDPGQPRWIGVVAPRSNHDGRYWPVSTGLTWEDCADLASANLIGSNFSASVLQLATAKIYERRSVTFCGVTCTLTALKDHPERTPVSAMFATRLGAEIILAMEPPSQLNTEYTERVREHLRELGWAFRLQGESETSAPPTP